MSSLQSAARNFAGLAVAIGVALVLLITGAVGAVRSGNYIVLPLLFTAVGLFAGAIWFSHYKVRVYLRDRTPDRIIAHYHRSVRRMPQAQAAAAYLSSIAASFFGDYDRARSELAPVAWDSITPVYRGYRSYALAVLTLLEDTDYPKAVDLAREGATLQKGDPAGGLALLDDAVRLVAEGEAPRGIERLQNTARKQQGLMPAFCAWALAVHYRKNNNAELASEFKELLKQLVPHCAALRSAPEAG